MKPSFARAARRFLVAASPVLIAACVAASYPSDASASPPVTAGAMVPIAGNLHPLARPEADVGRLDPSTQLGSLSLLFQRTPQQRSDAAALLVAQQTPGSPMYHRWLTPEQYAARFGASPDVLARATAWLQSQGLTVLGTTRMGERVEFRGAAGAVERAFATELHLYDVDGKTHFAMSRAPSVPADLAGSVLGVHGLHDFRPKPTPMQPLYSLPFPLPDGATVDVPSIGPTDFATIYDLTTLYSSGITGTGQSIAIAGQTDFNDADIAAFRTAFGLSTNPPTRVLVPNSGSSVVLDPDDLGETELDLEWSGAVAKDATIDFVYTGDDDAGGVFDAMIYAIEQHTAPLLSVSYGQCETELPANEAVFEEALGDAAAMTGMTVLAASGDTGAAGCDGQFSKAARHGEHVGLPASIPTVVAVGGTQFNLTTANQSMYLDSNDDALGYIPESGWNETQEDIEAGVGGLGAGTGGVSGVFPKPYWQVPYTPNDDFRDVPDVSLSASAAVMPYVVSYSWTAADGDAQAPEPEALTAVGGTSAATPSFAGILALVNQAIAMQSPTASQGLGNANPVLYALANDATTADAFHDVTLGNNIVPCQMGSPDCPSSPPYQFGYTAGPGYDQVTGLGTIDAAKLVAAWSALTPTGTTLAVAGTGMTEGSPITLTATVTSSAMSNALTGDVTFYFETFDSMGDIDLSGNLGSVPIVASTSGNEGGTATLDAKAPAGATGMSKIGAFYGGDTHYLASWSMLAPITATSNLAICPTTVTLLPDQTGFTFVTTGGSPPITWSVLDDSTCARVNKVETCSSFDGGVFTAGPAAGTATVSALDSNYSYVTATVTVMGNADAGTPLPVTSCAVPDAGTDGGATDAGAKDGAADAGAPSDASMVTDATGSTDGPGQMEMNADAGPGGGNGSSGGCGCVTAGGGARLAGGAWVGIGLLGLVFARRRRSRRDA